MTSRSWRAFVGLGCDASVAVSVVVIGGGVISALLYAVVQLFGGGQVAAIEAGQQWDGVDYNALFAASVLIGFASLMTWLVCLLRHNR